MENLPWIFIILLSAAVPLIVIMMDGSKKQKKTESAKSTNKATSSAVDVDEGNVVHDEVVETTKAPDVDTSSSESWNGVPESSGSSCGGGG